MRILQVGKFYPIRGGVEKVMYDLTIGLSKMGIQCDMLCASTENYPAREICLDSQSRIIVVDTKIKLASTMLAPEMIFTLRQIAKSYDIIHVHHPDPMAALALFFSGFKGKVVLHWHSDILKQKLLLKLYKPIQSWLINRADMIVGTTPVYVAHSPFLKEVQRKTTFVPIGIEPITAKKELVEQITNRYNGKYLVFSMGRLVEYKGYEYLIKAAKHMVENAHVVIGGKGPLRDELQRLIEVENVSDKVTLLGFVDDDVAHAYFQACDVFCLSSIIKTEAFAIVQIEAMSCGKPVISAHIEGSGVSWVNVNEQSGLIVPIEDENAIADAVNRLLEKSAVYDRLADGARNRYSENFTLTNMISRCLEVYKSLERTTY